MAKCPSRPMFVAGVVERHDNHVFIALPHQATGVPRRWLFPRGPVLPGESPEEAMRRITKENVGLAVEIVVGQPPILGQVEDREVELRYFFCGLAGGEAEPGPYADIRWIPKAHLREYDFDRPSQPVVDWLLEPER